MQKKDSRCANSKSPQFVNPILFGNPGLYPSLQDEINCKQQAIAFLRSAGGSKNAKTVSRLQSELDDLRKEQG